MRMSNKKNWMLFLIILLTLFRFGEIKAQDIKNQIDIRNLYNTEDKKESTSFQINNIQSKDYSQDTLIIHLDKFSLLDKFKIDEEIIEKYPKLNAIKIKIPKNINIQQLVDKYKNIIGVKDVSLDVKAHTTFIPNDQEFNKQWGLEKIQVPQAWDITTGHNSITVAVIDTGIGPHEDIKFQLVNGCSILTDNSTDITTVLKDTYTSQYSYDGGKDIYNVYGDPNVSPHGTAVASVIAAQTNNGIGIAGVAPSIKIMPIKVFGDGESQCWMSDVAKGVRWAVDNGADIINMSLGAENSSAIMDEAIQYAYNNDVILLASTGNDFTDSLSYPASNDYVLSVGASDSSDNKYLFSNYGLGIDVVAPGENIITSNASSGGYSDWFGTSFSAPFTSGVAALIKDINTSLSNFQIEQIICTATKDITSTGQDWDMETGYGRVNAYEAVQLASNNSIWDNNDSLNNPTDINISQIIKGEFYPAKDLDIYKINIPQNITINAYLNATQYSDPVIMLLDSNYDLVQYINENEKGTDEQLQFTSQNTQDYYFIIFDSYGNAIQEEYEFTINKQDILDGVSRIAGSTRYDTAAFISQTGWTIGSGTVILSSGEKFPDALSGSPLAYQLNAPILLCQENSIPSDTLAEIERLKPNNIYILGGPATINESIKQELEIKGYKVIRISDDTRFTTAIAIGEELRKYNQKSTAVITCAYKYPDALSFGPIAAKNNWPILFTDTQKLTGVTKNALTNWGITEVKIIGGPASVSDAVKKELEQMGITVERIWGQDREDVSIEAAKKYNANPEGVIITTGYKFADALTGGPLAGKFDYPILLVKEGSIKNEALTYIQNSGATKVVILGGEMSVNPSVRDQVESIMD